MSVYTDILSAVKANLTTALPAQNIRIRKKAVAVQDDTFPLVLVVPVKDEYQDDTFSGYVVLAYEVLVVCVNSGGDSLDTDFGILDTRQTVRQTLHQPTLSGADTVYDTQVDLQPVFDSSALSKTYNYSPLIFKFISREVRNP